MKVLTIVALVLGMVMFPQSKSAAACSWAVHELPAPSGYTSATVTGHAGAGIVVGTAWKTNHREGVIWNNGVPQLLPQPPGKGAGSNYPLAVNESGVIAGRWAGNDGGHTAWRYSNGSYQFLPNRGDWISVPTDINNSGDIVGFSRLFFGGTQVNTLLWRADTPATFADLGEAYPRGLDDSRRVVLSTGLVVLPNGTSLQLQGGAPSVYQDGHLIGYQGSAAPFTIIEWNLIGQIVRLISDGYASGVNTAGTLVGVHTNGKVTVWRNGGVEFVTSPAPARTDILDITDDNAIVSDYRVGGTTRVGIWRCN